jgi:hypothetical protein
MTGIKNLSDLEKAASEFLTVEEQIPNVNYGRLRYDIFVKAYNETREHVLLRQKGFYKIN